MYFVFIYLICLRDKISYKNIIKLLRVGLFFCDNFGIIFMIIDNTCIFGSAGKESACNAGNLGLIPGLGFPGGSGDRESTCNAGSPGSIPGSGRPLKKEMATHSSVLAWKIPWTQEPGGLQSTRSRVGHD